MYLQLLKDIDDIDHLTLEKFEENKDKSNYHFVLRRIPAENFSLPKAVKLLSHIEIWYPETAEVVRRTDFSDTDSVYNALRSVREFILKEQ